MRHHSSSRRTLKTLKTLKTHPLHALVFMTFLLLPHTHGAKTLSQAPGCEGPTFLSETDHCLGQAIARVNDFEMHTTGNTVLRAAGVRNKRSSPLVLAAKGTTAYCLEAIKHHNNVTEDKKIAVCKKWQDFAANLTTAVGTWKNIWGSDALVDSSFGSSDALVSSMVGAISAGRVNVTKFTLKLKNDRKKWLDDANDAIDSYGVNRTIGNLLSVVSAASCMSPGLCEVALAAEALGDLFFKYKAGVMLEKLEEMFVRGLLSLYMTEEGMHVKGMMDFMQTTFAMGNLKDPAWGYLARMLVHYVKSAIASNSTYTDAVVRGDLNLLQNMSPSHLDGYMDALANATFKYKTFREVEEALKKNSYKSGVDLFTIVCAFIKFEVHLGYGFSKLKNDYDTKLRTYKFEAISDPSAWKKMEKDYTYFIKNLAYNIEYPLSDLGKFKMSDDDAVCKIELDEHPITQMVDDTEGIQSTEKVAPEVWVTDINDGNDGYFYKSKRIGGGKVELISIYDTKTVISTDAHAANIQDHYHYTVNTFKIKDGRLPHATARATQQLKDIQYMMKGRPTLYRRSTAGKRVGWAMAGLAMSMSGLDLLALRGDVDDLKKCAATLMALNDGAMDIVVKTLRAWQE